MLEMALAMFVGHLLERMIQRKSNHTFKELPGITMLLKCSDPLLLSSAIALLWRNPPVECILQVKGP